MLSTGQPFLLSAKRSEISTVPAAPAVVDADGVAGREVTGGVARPWLPVAGVVARAASVGAASSPERATTTASAAQSTIPTSAAAANPPRIQGKGLRARGGRGGRG